MALPPNDDAPRDRPRVLLVDDDYLVRACLGAELEEMGLTVVAATGGDEARAILSSQPIDLAVIDIVLHGESGLPLASFASSLAVPVVLASGYAPEIEAERNGRFPVLSKPFRLNDVVEVLSATLPRWSPP